MTTFETARNSTTGATEAAGMPRRHVIAIALLMCVPLPLFSVAATVVPLPQIVQRAAATFISIAVPVAADDGPLIREKTAAVRPVKITYAPAERVRVEPAIRPNLPASQTRARAAHPSDGSKAAVQVDAGGGAHLGSGKTNPPAETTDPPTSAGPAADDQPGPGTSVDPPVPATPEPGGRHGPSGDVSGSGSSGGGNPGSGSAGGGSGGGSPSGGSSGGSSGGGSSGGNPSGGSSGGSSGGGSSGGDSGANPNDPPAHGRDNPPDGGSGKSEPPSSDPGSGPAPQPEPTPPAGGPPDKGHGKP